LSCGIENGLCDYMVKKNLLIISNTFPDVENNLFGGIFVKEQLKSLSKDFNKIYVICPIPFTFGIKRQDKFCRDYSFSNIFVYYPRFFHLPLNYFRKKINVNKYESIKKLIIKEKINFDLIHSHFTNSSGILGLMLKKEFLKKLVVTVHEDSNWLKSELNNKENQEVWEKADFLIRVNNKDVSMLKRFTNRIIAIPNGYNDNIFYFSNNKINLRKKYNLLESDLILVNVANYLILQKNQINLLLAISILVKKYSNLKLFLIGMGKDKEKIISKIKELDLINNVFVIGPMSQHLMNDYFNLSDLFVLPSYAEGNPTVMFESLGTGLLYVGSAVGGVPEIIYKDVGLLYNKPEDFNLLVEVIEKAINKRWDKITILNYSKNYTWDNIAKQILEVYKRIDDDI